MRAIQQPCEVFTLAPDGALKALKWNGRTYHLTHVLEQYRAGGRWWLGEPSRNCWVLQCGAVVLEVHKLEARRNAHSQGWIVARMKD